MSCEDGCDDHENPCDDCKEKAKKSKQPVGVLKRALGIADHQGFELPPEPAPNLDPHSWEPTDWMSDRRPEVVSGRSEPPFDPYDADDPNQQFPADLKSVGIEAEPLTKYPARKPAQRSEDELPDDWNAAMFKLPAAVSTVLTAVRICGRHEGNRRKVRVSLHPDSTAGCFLAPTPTSLPTNTPTAVTDPNACFGLDPSDGLDEIVLENRGEVWAVSDGSAIAILRVLTETDSPNI